MTEILPSRTSRQRAKAESRATELLRAGEAIALPTETVYGLAANALKPLAVAKIFEAKGRPRFDPLIVHLPNCEWLERVAHIPDEDRKLISKLTDRFWPGPFTIVLPRRAIVPEIVTAGLDTVAVRISAHPVFSTIIRAFGSPLAAPSANRFGRLSPTTAQHVHDELNDRIRLIVDAGPTEHGIESTIVGVRGHRIEVLRRGAITSEQLAEFGEIVIASPGVLPQAPGQLPMHYAPKTPLQLVDNVKSFSRRDNQRVGLLAWNPVESEERFAAVRQLSEQQNLREAAANLFRFLRELDDSGLDLIIAEGVPDESLGSAILDRLRRAACPEGRASARPTS